MSMEMKVNLSRPDITEAEIQAVVDVLRTPNLSLGPKVREFEQAFHFKLRTEVIPYGYGSLPYEILKAQEIEAASYRIVSQFSTGRYCGVWGALRSCS